MSRLRPTFVLSALLLIIVPIWCGGCAQFDPRRGIPWRQDEEIENSEAPDKLIAVWNDTVLYQPNKPPVRGFGGRVFFYGNEEDQPIRVDGTIILPVGERPPDLSIDEYTQLARERLRALRPTA